MNDTPRSNAPRRLDRSTIIPLTVFLAAFAAILAFVFTLGPTSQGVACRRATGECEIRESYLFGLGATRRRVFPQSALASVRIEKPVNPVGSRVSPPMIVELDFKDGTTRPTVDYLFRSWARRKVDEFNRYLGDPTAPEMILDSTAPALAALLLFGGAPLLFGVLLWLLRRKIRARA